MAVVAGLLQTVAIVYLLIEINQLNRHLTESPENDISYEPTRSNTRPIAQTTQQVANQLQLDRQPSDIELIRQTMRQELQALLADNRSKQQQRAAFRSQDPVLIEEFTHQLDMFISQGSISNHSMESFHAKLALLSPHDQKNILSHMAQAINNGQLKIIN